MPAIRRAEEFEKQTTGKSSIPAPQNGKPLGNRPARGGAPDFEPGTPGHRKQIVDMAFMGVMGLKRDAAERKYDEQLRQWYAEQGVKPPPGAFPSEKPKPKNGKRKK